MSPNPSPMIEVEGLINAFGSQVVHDHLAMTIRRGEIIGIVGGSGTGKSVLLRTLLGLNTPQAGTIKVMGRRMTPNQLLNQRWGVLFQKGALFSSLTVFQNIEFPLREWVNLPNKTLRQLANLKLEMVGLETSDGYKYPASLSGGMIKRVALARALATDPHVVFLDEPTSGLDPVSANEFDDLLLYLNKNLQLTVVMVSHDLDSLFKACDRVAVLVNKTMVIDTPEKITHNPDPWIQTYFNGPRSRLSGNQQT